MQRLDVSSIGFDGLIEREWLETNGLGGFASGTVAGVNTRKYHGLLVAAVSPPVRRMVLLSRIEETVRCDAGEAMLGCAEYPGVVHPRGFELLRAFDASPFPRWAYQGDGWAIEKSVRLIRGENTVIVSYLLLGGDRDVELEARPLMALRGIHELSSQWGGGLGVEPRPAGGLRIAPSPKTPEVFFAHDGEFSGDGVCYLGAMYRREGERGYHGMEDLWSPGVIRWRLRPGIAVHLACSTDPVDLPEAIDLSERQAAGGGVRVPAGEPGQSEVEAMVGSLDAFALRRSRRMHAPSPEPAVATAYPWTPPNLREALIGFGGAYCVPRRLGAGRELLAQLASQQKEGLIPSHLDERGELKWRAVDVSLWYVNAAGQLAEAMGVETPPDPAIGEAVRGVVRSIRRGEAPGALIEADGLLGVLGRGYPPTWMDAELDDWTINPRVGRPVEVNALWYNAVRIAGEFAAASGQTPEASELHRLAARIRHAFNARFWNAADGCCYDVLARNSADPTVRPNQVLAASLRYPVLDPRRWESMLNRVRERLLTRYGLRSLDPGDPAYRGRYGGDVLCRDRAQHNGSVYPWLLAHYLDAVARTQQPGPAWRRQAAEMLQPLLDRLMGDGLGWLPELFDGEAPHAPGGAIASGVSAAELLRAYSRHVLGVPLEAPGDLDPPASPSRPDRAAMRPPKVASPGDGGQ